MNSNRERWAKQALEMRECKSITDLRERFGEPNHKVQTPACDVWHYHLGVDQGTLYAVHVAIAPDATWQAYLHMEPSSSPDSPPSGPKVSWAVIALLLLAGMALAIVLRHYGFFR